MHTLYTFRNNTFGTSRTQLSLRAQDPHKKNQEIPQNEKKPFEEAKGNEKCLIMIESCYAQTCQLPNYMAHVNYGYIYLIYIYTMIIHHSCTAPLRHMPKRTLILLFVLCMAVCSKQ